MCNSTGEFGIHTTPSSKFESRALVATSHDADQALPSGKKVSTKGLSFKHVDVENTKFILLDSEGSYAPVRVENELSVVEKARPPIARLRCGRDYSRGAGQDRRR